MLSTRSKAGQYMRMAQCMMTINQERVNTSKNHIGKLAIFKLPHTQWCVQEGCSGSPPLALSPTDRRQSSFLGEMNRAKALKPSRTQGVGQQAGARPAGPSRIKKSTGPSPTPSLVCGSQPSHLACTCQVRSTEREPLGSTGEEQPRPTSQEILIHTAVYQQLFQGKEVA